MNYPLGRSLLLNTVGFERLIDAFEKLDETDSMGKGQSYPPYNIIKKNESNYLIEIAVAGFSSEDIDITSEGNKLTIKGSIKNVPQTEYIHKGIATRDFEHHFTLAETVVIRDADLKNGLLVIALENVIPKEKLPRKIMIGKHPQVTENEKELIEA